MGHSLLFRAAWLPVVLCMTPVARTVRVGRRVGPGEP